MTVFFCKEGEAEVKLFGGMANFFLLTKIDLGLGERILQEPEANRERTERSIEQQMRVDPARPYLFSSPPAHQIRGIEIGSVDLQVALLPVRARREGETEPPSRASRRLAQQDPQRQPERRAAVDGLQSTEARPVQLLSHGN